MRHFDQARIGRVWNRISGWLFTGLAQDSHCSFVLSARKRQSD